MTESPKNDSKKNHLSGIRLHDNNSEKNNRDHSHVGCSHSASHESGTESADGNEHSHDHHHGMRGQAPQVIVRAILVTFAFMIVEVVGGYVANSLALISDAAHMLTDVGAMFLSLFAIWIAKRPTTSKMSFGYQRAEILGALVSALLIWVISGWLIYEAVIRMQSPPEVQGSIVFVVATVGLIANLVSMWMLHSAKNENLNVRAAYLHLLSDSLGSVGAIIAGIILWLTDWRPIDPIVTIFFAVLMLISSWSLVKETIAILMESTPTHVDSDQVSQDLALIPGVQEVHDLHIWTVSSGKLALSVHLISEQSEATLLNANQLLQEKYKIAHTTIQVEHPERFQSEKCYDCMPGRKA